MVTYLAKCGSKEHHTGDFADALLWIIRECRDTSAQIYRASLVASLTPQEVTRLASIVSTITVVEQSAGQPTDAREDRGARGRVSVVFDQMYKGFADVIAREIRDNNVLFHEIVGRGLDKPVRQGRIYRQPARDDYDIIQLVERLAREGPVILFTGDKKLANQASMLEGDIVVEYLPPGEFTGKEMALRYMVERIKDYLRARK